MTLTLPDYFDRDACFSEPDRKFRYWLRRRFLPEAGKPLRLCIWMNPSDADDKKDDASIRVGMGFARRWGDGGILVLNVLDLVLTDSAKLPEKRVEAVGPSHWWHLRRALAGKYGEVTKDVLCGWGDAGSGESADTMLALLRGYGYQPTALALTKSGNPGHPLRKSYSLVPFKF